MAPLNWGLGHATRCIPLINQLLQSGYDVLIGSDGAALKLLRAEFPSLESIELPSYNIQYSNSGSFFKAKLLQQLPHISNAISAEKKVVKELVQAERIHGIISDNRPGVRSKKVPSVYLTHQLHVLSGSTSWLSSNIHMHLARKFDQCWVPDYSGEGSLSGKLGHTPSGSISPKYIGPLSRMKAKETKINYDILCLLSGPEPQRSILENKLRHVFKDSPKKILLVQGNVEDEKIRTVENSIEIINFLTTPELEQAINESELIIARSGYTTIMDLAAMGKKALFIPTPGQYEQRYLAKRLKSKGIIPSCKQSNFDIHQLKRIAAYSGFKAPTEEVDRRDLFRLFEGK